MIEVYCSHGTGKAHHFIAWIDPDDPTRPLRDNRRLGKHMYYSNRDREPTHDPTYTDGARKLTCPECPRNPELRPETLTVLADGLVRAGRDSVDVSALPF